MATNNVALELGTQRDLGRRASLFGATCAAVDNKRLRISLSTACKEEIYKFSFVDALIPNWEPIDRRLTRPEYDVQTR